MILQPYDTNYSLPPFGLQNSGVLCYLNTCIQSLYSLPVFNKMICDDKYQDNILVVELKNLYKDVKKFKDTKIYNLHFYLKSIDQTRIIDGRQNDSFEIFKFILELLPVDFYNIFYLKYHLIIQCSNCKKITNTTIQNELTVNLSMKITPNGKVLDNDKDINDYIKCNMNILEDYICEMCSKKNTSTQYYKIGNIPNCIIISYHDNHNNLLKNCRKETRYFPSVLYFTTKNNSNVCYEPASVVKHFGSLNSGHYNGEFLRNNTHLDDRIELFEQKYITEKNIQQRNKYIVCLTKLQKRQLNKLEKFNINDSNFFELNNFNQSENTYYVIYVLKNM